MSIFVQLSDPHIREPGRLAYGRINTAPYLATAVKTILTLPQQPLAVVITGDLTDFGREAEYAHLSGLLSPLPMPVYLLPGNHDDRSQMRASFPDHAYLGTEGFMQYSVCIGEVRMLTLDKLPSDEAFEAYTTSLDAVMRERTAILELNDAIAVLAKSSAKRAATRLRLAAENEQLRSQVEGVAERALAQRIARLQSSLRRTGEEDDDDA